MQALLTQQLRELFTSTYPLSSQDAKGNDAKVIAKFFFPAGRYTFFATEGSPEGDDFTFFGYCLSPLTPDFDEWGYTSLAELSAVRIGLLGIERDAHLEPGRHTVGELLHLTRS
jgi:hypothetical protein